MLRFAADSITSLRLTERGTLLAIVRGVGRSCASFHSAAIDGARLLCVMAWARDSLRYPMARNSRLSVCFETLIWYSSQIHWRRSMIRQRITPCTAGFGPFSTIAASAARSGHRPGSHHYDWHRLLPVRRTSAQRKTGKP